MPQPPATHVAARVEIVGLLLPGLGGGATEKRAEASLAALEAQEEAHGGEHVAVLREALDGRFVVVEVAAAGNKALVVGGDSGELEEAIPDGTRVEEQ